MNLLWERFTLSSLPLKEYVNTSYLHRLVGILSPWRQTSLLMQWGDMLSAALISLIYGLAPFVSSTLTGILLLAAAALWLILTISDADETNLSKISFTPIHLVVLLYWFIAVVSAGLSPVKKAAF